MTIVAEIERLQTERPAKGDLCNQLDQMRRLREEQGAGGFASQQPGMDRSRDLTPVARPTIVRTLVA